MCLLFETIRIVNGVAEHLHWHNRRMNQAGRASWGVDIPLITAATINVPPEYSVGLVRCNIHYKQDVQEVSFKKYEKKIIRSLKMVEGDDVDYHLKYADRSALASLFSRRGTSNEIIIVKNGLITDTSMSNLIFFDGTNWVTPAHPLLKGTCRERLLAEGLLIEQDIHPGDLNKFKGCKLINAMRDHQEETLIPISEIT